VGRHVCYALGIGATKDELRLPLRGARTQGLSKLCGRPKSTRSRAPREGRRAAWPWSCTAREGEDPAAVRAAGTLYTTATIRGIYDMRRFASVIVDMSRNEAQNVVCQTSSNIIFRERRLRRHPPPKEEYRPRVPQGSRGRLPGGADHLERASAALPPLGDFNPLTRSGVRVQRGLRARAHLSRARTFGYMVRHAAKGGLGETPRSSPASARSSGARCGRGKRWSPRLAGVAGQRSRSRMSVQERDEAVLGSAWAQFENAVSNHRR